MFFCKTQSAVLLLGVEIEGVLRFPSAPVIRRAGRTPVVELFVEYAKTTINSELRGIDIHYWHQFSETVMLYGEEQTLCVARILPEQKNICQDWVTMPNLIRSLPKDRSRLPWLKAWQVYAGGYDQECRAVEADETMMNSIPKP
ncbi:MAG: hypothetical protein AB8C84_07035 [Oligoflexales bacterium]